MNRRYLADHDLHWAHDQLAAEHYLAADPYPDAEDHRGDTHAATPTGARCGERGGYTTTTASDVDCVACRRAK